MMKHIEELLDKRRDEDKTRAEREKMAAVRRCDNVKQNIWLLRPRENNRR